MAKADPIAAAVVERHIEERRDPEKEAAAFFSDLVLLALPVPLFQKLSNAAARRNMRLPELLTRAVDEFLTRTES